jgi:hypothetical protein
MSDNKTIRDAMDYIEVQLQQAEDPGKPLAVFMAKKMVGTVRANLEMGKTLDDEIDTEL